MSIAEASIQEIKSPAQSSKAFWLKQVRQLHLYLGTFFAPSILFFALTGALQLFGLHQGHPGEAYQPPEWVAKLGALHKNQNLATKRPPQSGSAAGQAKAPEVRPEVKNDAPKPPQGRTEARRQSPFTIALKWFFLASSAGLVFTTLLGIYMAFKFNRNRGLVWGSLIAGTVIPTALVVLLAIQQ